jgi:predicted O-methyltransferase YrrM
VSRSVAFEAAVLDWIASATVREHPQFAALRRETDALEWARMRIGPQQAAFMTFLARTIGARRALEVGVFTGSSALAVALALPVGGQLVALDVSEEWTAIAQRHWAAAGVADRIDLRIGPAIVALDEMLRRGERFDFAFIDADKPNYPAYYNAAVRLVRPGGLVLVDNALWGGRVADPTADDADTVAIRAVVERAADDARVDAVLLPVGDGLLVARVKG